MSSELPERDPSVCPASRKFSGIDELMLNTVQSFDRKDLVSLKNLRLASRQMDTIASERIKEIGGFDLQDFHLKTTDRKVPARCTLSEEGELPLTADGEVPPVSSILRTDLIFIGQASPCSTICDDGKSPRSVESDLRCIIGDDYRNSLSNLETVLNAPVRDYGPSAEGYWCYTTLHIEGARSRAKYDVPTPRIPARLFARQELHCPQPKETIASVRFVPQYPMSHLDALDMQKILSDPPLIQSVEPDETVWRHYPDEELADMLGQLQCAHHKKHGHSIGRVAVYVEDDDTSQCHSRAVKLCGTLDTSRIGLKNLEILRRRDSLLPLDTFCLQSVDPSCYLGVESLTLDVIEGDDPMQSKGRFPPSLKSLTLSYHDDIPAPQALSSMIDDWASAVDPEGRLSIKVQTRDTFTGDITVSHVSDMLEKSRLDRAEASSRETQAGDSVMRE